MGKNEEEVEKSPLWHGASFDVVSKIVADKFDRRFTGANGKYLQQCEHFTYCLLFWTKITNIYAYIINYYKYIRTNINDEIMKGPVDR